MWRSGFAIRKIMNEELTICSDWCRNRLGRESKICKIALWLCFSIEFILIWPAKLDSTLQSRMHFQSFFRFTD
jgi:hypothetical protein